MGECKKTRRGGGGAELVSIVITSPPTTTTYITGQVFDPAGMVVEAVYSDGERFAVDGFEYPTTPFVGGETEVVVSYTERGITVTASQAITIITVNPVLNNNSWETIAKVSAVGKASEYWKVGDTKSETLDGTVHNMEIIGFDHDDLNSADARYNDANYNGNTKKAGITFCMKELFPTEYAMKSSGVNTGGWNGSDMRTTRMSTIKGYMSSTLRNALRTVSKIASDGGTTNAPKTSADQLFLLAESEAFIGRTHSIAGEGTQYAYYKAGNSRAKYKAGSSGSSGYWWLRSARSDTSTFVIVWADGSVSYSNAATNNYIAAAFCI